MKLSSESMFLCCWVCMFLVNHCNHYAGVMHFDDEDHSNGQEVTSWKVLSPDAIQVRNDAPLRYITLM